MLMLSEIKFTISYGLLLSFLVSLTTPSSELLPFRLYYTDRLSEDELQFDCLYYYVPAKSKREQQPFSHEIIPYCYRPLFRSDKHTIKDIDSITFEELKRRKITVQQLQIWSAPVDLLERYQFYLDQTVPATLADVFYNCSGLWFGSTCQYTFDSSNDFAQIVQETFRMKEGNYNDILNVTEGGTCYHFLPCMRGPGNNSCLDWREVCDGKMDCIGSGIDEKSCFELLELNECGPDEFRCRNGLCVPDEFLWENSLDSDCLDGSDEAYGGKHFGSCYQDPAFRCEERTCQTSLELFACGDGECVLTVIPSDSNLDGRCANGREMMLSRAFLAREETPDLSELCWSAMICALRIVNRLYPLFESIRCEKICGQNLTPTCDSLVEQNCPSLFQFPAHPLVHGHVTLMYSNEHSRNIGRVRKPKYLCYDKRLCPKLSLIQNVSNDIVCISDYRLHVPDIWYTKFNVFIRDIVDIFHRCPSIDVIDNSTICRIPGLFRCKDTLSCFSEHRLVDGVQDCFTPDDEVQPCSMNNNTHRFQCTSENKCISLFCVHNNHDDCIGGEDELGEANSRQQMVDFIPIPFQILCDGFEEYSIKSGYQVIETDETHCDLWLCDNQYTRCNIYYNCPNGADEAHCSWTSCPPQYLPCVEPITKNVTCLPLALANDNITHCLGSSDERYECRTPEASILPDFRYKCWNETGPYSCISVESLCDGDEDCEFGDDEQFCNHNGDNYSPTPCSGLSNGDRTASHNLLCKLTDVGKPRTVYFSLKNAIAYPLTTPRLSKVIQEMKNDYTTNFRIGSQRKVSSIDFYRAWYCNRGIFVRHQHMKQICLCPPSYYGDRCQSQSQRVSVTVQIKAPEYRTMFALVLTLIDDNKEIHSHEQLTYIPFRDCKDKFNRVLLYKSRPKDALRKYSVQIQAFDKSTFVHRATWLFPIKFPVLPVYRLVQQLIIPMHETVNMTHKCPLKCQHGLCQHYLNREDFFCRCDPNWLGVLCDTPKVCQCSFDSLCIGVVNKRSICVCPPHKFGPRCLLTHSVCPGSYCHHHGQCIYSDERISHENFVCLCQDGYSGATCKNIQTRIDISFAADLSIPQAVLGHFITVFNDSNPTRVSTYKKVAFDLDTVTLYFTDPFHILFTEFGQNFYLTVLRETFIHSSHISARLITPNRCLPVEELLDANILKFPRLRHIKYYHVPCQTNSDLVCFYDKTLTCLCNDDRFANCFNFDRSVTYSCPGYNYCENGGRCFQNSETCQTPLLCVCAECFYGKRCHLTTKGFGLSLDAILGYQIHPNVPLSRQPAPVKASIVITTTMVVIGFVSSFLSIITFRRKGCRETGCGYYLFMSSICSLATMIFLLMKFWFLVLSQMIITRKVTLLSVGCVSMDALLRISLNAGDWLNAAVAIERVFNVWYGIHFSQQKSKQSVRWVFFAIFLFTVSTTVHDPIHRHIVFDEEEQRTWCLLRYSPILQHFNSIMNIIHFLIPFSINIISALVIIVRVARVRSTVRTKLTYKQNLRKQVEQHKHLLISPFILVLLGLPRIIISFISGCMKSARDPWLFLIAYFISFIPPILIFFTFILPSAIYRREFKEAIKYVRRCYSLQ